MASTVDIVAIGMSGGVDSTAAAALLVKSGQPAAGVTIKMWDCAEYADVASGSGACCSPRDAADAAGACRKLGIEHFLVNLEAEFKEEVLLPFCREYARGRTPSPCIGCNRLIKFGLLFDRIAPAGCNVVATGHYARVSHDPQSGVSQLLRGLNHKRDQTYFLSGLSQEQLSKIQFPVGYLDKSEVRSIVSDLGLRIAEKEASQEFCFAPDGNYDNILAKYAPEALVPGDLVDSSGKKLGQHRGIGRYTIGQRRGLGVATGEPIYVQKIDADDNRVIVGPDQELFADGLIVESVNWTGPAIEAPFECTVRVRHGGSETDSTVVPHADGTASVSFSEPVRAVAPGQQAVFYKDDLVIGGGCICGGTEQTSC